MSERIIYEYLRPTLTSHGIPEPDYQDDWLSQLARRDESERSQILSLLDGTFERGIATQYGEQHARAYISFLIGSYPDFESQELDELAYMLTHREAYSVHSASIETLRQIELDNNKTLHKKVYEARSFLRSFLPLFTPENSSACWIFYGSLQYNDPKNLDGDLLYLSLDEHIDTSPWGKHIPESLVRGVHDSWSDFALTPDTEPHFSFSHPAHLAHFAKFIEQYGPEEAYCAAIDASVVLSGSPLLSSDENFHLFAREVYTQIIQRDPLLTFLVNITLKQCIDIRTNR